MKSIKDLGRSLLRDPDYYNVGFNTFDSEEYDAELLQLTRLGNLEQGEYLVDDTTSLTAYWHLYKLLKGHP